MSNEECFRHCDHTGFSFRSLRASGHRAKNEEAAAAPKSIRIDISKDKVGGESSKFLSVVGNWSVVDDGGKKAYAVYGRE